METKNNTSGFLKYAIQEIVLVVIGILIAVSINNWNENRKNKNELQNIFLTVKEDIKNDIQEIDKVLKAYKKVEPVYHQILNDSISKTDYETNKRKAYLILGYPEISFDQRGYKLLSNYNESNNEYSDSLTNNIIEFYSERMLEIKVDEKLRIIDFEENFKYWKNNTDWWAEYIHEKEISRFLDYALNSKDYKNRVATSHFLTYEVYLPELIEFRERGLNIVKSIEKKER